MKPWMGFTVLRVRPTPSRLLDNIPLHSIPSVRRPWGKGIDRRSIKIHLSNILKQYRTLSVDESKLGNACQANFDGTYLVKPISATQAHTATPSKSRLFLNSYEHNLRVMCAYYPPKYARAIKSNGCVRAWKNSIPF